MRGRTSWALAPSSRSGGAARSARSPLKSRYAVAAHPEHEVGDGLEECAVAAFALTDRLHAALTREEEPSPWRRQRRQAPGRPSGHGRARRRPSPCSTIVVARPRLPPRCRAPSRRLRSSDCGLAASTRAERRIAKRSAQGVAHLGGLGSFPEVEDEARDGRASRVRRRPTRKARGTEATAKSSSHQKNCETVSDTGAMNAARRKMPRMAAAEVAKTGASTRRRGAEAARQRRPGSRSSTRRRRAPPR